MKWCTDAGIKRKKRKKKEDRSFLEISMPISKGYELTLPNGIQISCSGVLTPSFLKLLLDA